MRITLSYILLFLSVAVYAQNDTLVVSHEDYQLVDYLGKPCSLYKKGNLSLPLNGAFRLMKSNNQYEDLFLKDNLYEGVRNQYYARRLVKSSHYKAGMLHGKQNTYSTYRMSDQSNIEFLYREENFNEGLEVGFSKFYYHDGTISRICFFNEKGQSDDMYHEFYKDGGVKVRGVYINDKKNGDWYYYYPNQQISLIKTFSENGTMSKAIHYHKTGNVDWVKHYKDRVYDGEHIVYSTHYKDGIYSYTNYVNGYVRGKVIKIDYGTMDQEVYYINNSGRMQGKYTRYAKDSERILLEGKFKRGVKHGKWHCYAPNGKIYRILLFNNGVLKGQKDRAVDFNGVLFNANSTVSLPSDNSLPVDIKYVMEKRFFLFSE